MGTPASHFELPSAAPRKVELIGLAGVFAFSAVVFASLALGFAA